ncbi:hypothetical protein J6590_087627 [Homalodisca vitripennis]|nr:hypothetical protein J6590_087627 [Homalodisca vitripennis]
MVLFLYWRSTRRILGPNWSLSQPGGVPATGRSATRLLVTYLPISPLTPLAIAGSVSHPPTRRLSTDISFDTTSDRRRSQGRSATRLVVAYLPISPLTLLAIAGSVSHPPTRRLSTDISFDTTSDRSHPPTRRLSTDISFDTTSDRRVGQPPAYSSLIYRYLLLTPLASQGRSATRLVVAYLPISPLTTTSDRRGRSATRLVVAYLPISPLTLLAIAGSVSHPPTRRLSTDISFDTTSDRRVGQPPEQAFAPNIAQL